MLGMLLQRFEFVDHANYQLRIKESLTLKPDGLTITIRPRSGRTWGSAPRPAAAADKPRTAALAVAPADRHGTPLLVLFGSNLGAAEDLATRIARDATDRGYTARTAGARRRASGSCRPRAPSWSSPPPTTGSRRTTRAGSARGSTTPRPRRPGCATRSSAAATATGPRPTRRCRSRVDAGSRRAARRGCTRAARATPAATSTPSSRPGTPGCGTPWASALGLDASTTAAAGSGPRLAVELEQRRTASPVLQSYRGQAATVRVNRELTARAGTPGGRSVRHLEIALPAGTSYAAGDHLGVLPRNEVRLVNRVLARFGLDGGQYVTLTATGSTPTHLPVGEPYPLLGHPGRLRRAAGRREPRRPGGDGRRTCRRAPPATSSRAWPAPTTTRRPATGRRSRSRGARCSTCSRTTRSATCPSRSSSTCCRRCARATTRSPRRRR